MDLLKNAPSPSTRLNRGNVLLANAQTVNTKPLKPRFDAFADIHRRYIEAHTKVDEAEALERAELKTVEQVDGALNKTIAALSAALLLDGEPLRNTFGRFAEHGPGQCMALPFADKVKEVHDLSATLHRSMGLSEATLAAADQAEQAALKVRDALPGWELRRTNLGLARQARDSLGKQWDTAYRALRNMTKSVVEERDLYTTLFPRFSRSKKPKPAEPAKPPVAANPPQPPPTGEPPPSNQQAA